MKIHIVQKGDTLWELSKKYGVDFEELKQHNSQLSSPDMIMPGMKIKIPSSTKQVKKEAIVKETKKEEQVKVTPKPKPVIKEDDHKEKKEMKIEMPIHQMPQPQQMPQHMMQVPIMQQVQNYTTVQPPEYPPKVKQQEKMEVKKEVKKEIPKQPNIPHMDQQHIPMPHMNHHQMPMVHMVPMCCHIVHPCCHQKHYVPNNNIPHWCMPQDINMQYEQAMNPNVMGMGEMGVTNHPHNQFLPNMGMEQNCNPVNHDMMTYGARHSLPVEDVNQSFPQENNQDNSQVEQQNMNQRESNLNEPSSQLGNKSIQQAPNDIFNFQQQSILEERLQQHENEYNRQQQYQPENLGHAQQMSGSQEHVNQANHHHYMQQHPLQNPGIIRPNQPLYEQQGMEQSGEPNVWHQQIQQPYAQQYPPQFIADPARRPFPTPPSYPPNYNMGQDEEDSTKE